MEFSKQEYWSGVQLPSPNMLSRLVITFLPRSKCLLISWLQSPSAVILEPRKIKSATVSPSVYHEVMGLEAMIFVFWMLSFKPTFSLSSFTFIKMWLHLEIWPLRRCLRAQSYLTLCHPMDCSPPGFSVHGILQASILEWVAISFSKGSSQPKDQNHISSIVRRVLYH